MGILARGEGEGHVGVAHGGREFAAAGSGNNYILAAVRFTDRRWRETAKGKFVLPKFFTGIFVESADHLVARPAAKDQSARGYNRAAEIFSARFRHALGRQFRVLTLRHFPAKFAGVQIDAIEGAPRRLAARITFMIEKFRITIVRVLRRGGDTAPYLGGGRVLWPVTEEDEVEQRLFF